MNYENLYDEFKTVVPEGSAFYEEKEEENDLDETDGQHIYFGEVVVPYIRELLKSNEDEKLKKVFAFLEEMEKDKDPKVCEVVEFTVLEQLSDNKEELEKLKPYMGPETRKALHSMAWWLNINA